MMSLRGLCGNVSAAVLLAGLLFAGTADAQDYSSIGISDVVASADRMLQRGDYGGAIPALREVINRTSDLLDAQGKATCQMCRFELARALFQTGQLTQGVKVLEEYLQKEPIKQERMALRMMAQGLFEVKEWDRIEALAKRLLALNDLDKEDEYNGNLLLGQALFQQEEWKESVNPLTFASRKSPDEKVKALCSIMAVRALVEAENWYELFGRIPRIYRTDAKYDISLNLTLMKAGRAQFEEESFLNSLLLYRMVLPREVLLGNAQKNLDALTEELMEQSLPSAKDELTVEINSLKESMKTLSELPPYEEEVSFRIGQIYAEVLRYWEAYVLFDKLYRTAENEDISDASMMQSVLILYDVNEPDKALQRVIQYLEEKPDGAYARTLLSVALRNMLLAQQYSKMIEMDQYVHGLPPSSESAEQMLQADIHYMMAFGYFQLRDYPQAVKEHTYVVRDYPYSPNASEALYYRGMAWMMQTKYAEALQDFVDYQARYEGAVQYASAMFREGVCLFGLQNVVESEKVFTKFIERYPENPMTAEAYAMRGDIEAAKESSIDDPDTLDRALADYRKAIDLATSELQASYPAFQAAEVYQLESKWQDIVDLMQYYINRWEEKADVAEAVFWIGKAQISLGKVAEGLDAYMDVIERFGNDAGMEGIDKIIVELVQISQQHLSAEDREGLLIRIKLKLAAADGQDVLQLRLRVALAYLEGEEMAQGLGVELLNAGQDLKTASPLSLALMCDAAVSSENAEEMERLYDYFAKTYEESELLWHAYRAKAFQLLGARDYEGVLAILDEAQGLFGVETFMGWAQIMKADTFYKQGKYEDAEREYNMIMGVPDWRGPIFAEGMYGMGLCRLGTEDYATAHSYFQRTYLLFRSYADGEWAAKAYLAAAKCLLKLDRPDDARNTLQAMLDDTYTKDSDLADMAREQLKKYGSQE